MAQRPDPTFILAKLKHGTTRYTRKEVETVCRYIGMCLGKAQVPDIEALSFVVSAIQDIQVNALQHWDGTFQGQVRTGLYPNSLTYAT